MRLWRVSLIKRVVLLEQTGASIARARLKRNPQQDENIPFAMMEEFQGGRRVASHNRNSVPLQSNKAVGGRISLVLCWTLRSVLFMIFELNNGFGFPKNADNFRAKLLPPDGHPAARRELNPPQRLQQCCTLALQLSS